MTRPHPAAVPPELYRAIVEHANELITVFNHHGTIMFVNDSCRGLLGYEPRELLGRTIFEFVHADERARAEITLQVIAGYGSIPATTHFRLRTKDGDYRSLELTSGTLPDSEHPYLMTISRPAGTRFALDGVLRLLLEDRSLRDVRATVCDLFAWQAIGSYIAITWQGADGQWDWVGTPGCPPELAGIPMTEPSPWRDAVDSGRAFTGNDLAALSPPLRSVASAADRGGYWISPVIGMQPPALISAWTPAGGHPPAAHAEGMELAARLLRLIGRWAGQQAALDRAANFDELTGLPNRQSFFRTLSTSAHGAVLYCDLDRFKPVNDKYGHAAGDEVLRQVAARLRDTVRATDTVARIGGDEFAIICPASTRADADRFAERIRAAVERPIGIEAGEVRVGISIGISHTTDRLDADSVAEADRALYEAKAERRARYLAAQSGAPGSSGEGT